MNDTLTFSQTDAEKSDPLHYKACGVDGIYLESGYQLVEDEIYGPGLIIEDAENLHKEIGFAIALSRPRLSFRDVRFLRRQMGKSQAALGNEIGVSEQMIARYEKDDQTDITGPADRVLRALYVTHLFPEHQTEVMNVIIGLYQEAESNVENLVFSRAQMHWQNQSSPLKLSNQ